MSESLSQVVIGRLLHGMYENPTTGVYKPTLVVGLGGSGMRALRVLKRELAKGKTKDGETIGVRLFGIDCDIHENDQYPELPPLARSELCVMEAPVGVNVLARTGKDSAYDYVADYLPPKKPKLHMEVRKKIAAGVGAGQFRRAGKLIFGANVIGGVGILRRMQAIQQSMTGLRRMIETTADGVTAQDGVDIFVVTSFAGGTGAGVLLDFIALTRSLFSGINDKVTVIGLLPGQALDKELLHPQVERRATQGNAYGVLQELGSFMRAGVSYEFRFDPAKVVAVDPTVPFVDATYLVGDKLFDPAGNQVPVERWIEICEAAAYFLYALVGTGVGATEASGAINSPGVEGWSACGVGVAHYPVEAMAEYAIRMAVEAGCVHWLDAPAPAAAVKTQVATTVTTCQLGQLASLRSGVPSYDKEDFALHWPRASDRKKSLKLSDAVFLKRCKDKRRQVDVELARRDQESQASCQKIIHDVDQKLDQRARTLVSGPHDLAIAHFELLSKQLDVLHAQLDQEQKKREVEEKRLAKRFVWLEKRINWFDFGLDRKYRQEYIKKTNDYLRLRCEAHRDRHVGTLIVGITARVNQYAAALKSLKTAMADIRRRNREVMAQFRPRRPSFMFSMFSAKALREWCQRGNFGSRIRTDRVISRLSAEALLLESLTDVETAVQQALSDLNLLQDAQQDSALAQRMSSLNIASLPLLPMRIGVVPGSLSPQKFVAGDSIDEPSVQDFATATFPPPTADTNTQLSTLSNPHAVLCTQTIHGFSILDWTGFTGCELAFLEDAKAWAGQPGWDYRTIADSHGIEPLRPRTEAERTAYRGFGLGVMIDALAVAGSNYYQNLSKARTGAYTFLTYSVDRREAARLLVEKGIVREAPSGHTRKQPDRRIAASLSDCIKALCTPEWTDLLEQIEDAVDQLKSTAGSERVCSLVTGFCESFVDARLRTADANHPLWEKVRDALERFVESFDKGSA